MKKTLWLAVGLILVLPSKAAAQWTLPPQNFAAGWQKTDQLLHFTKPNLFDYIDGGAELFLEFGFSELWVQNYTHGADELVLEVYKMVEPAAALGIYLTRCGNETPIAGIATTRNSGSRLQFSLIKGSYFIQVNNANGREALVPDMVVLTEALLSSIPVENPVNLFDYLPKKNLIKGSERLVRGVYSLQLFYTFGAGDVLLLEGRNFGVVGDYHDEIHGDYTHLKILYPDSQSVKQAYENLVNHLDSYLKITRKNKNGFVFRDFQEKFGKVELKDKLLDILIKLTKEPSD